MSIQYRDLFSRGVRWGEGWQRCLRVLKNILSVNAFGRNTYFLRHTRVLKDIAPYPNLLAFLVKTCELDGLGVVQSFSIDQNVLNLTLQGSDFIISKNL